MNDRDMLSRKLAYWKFKSKTFAFIHGYFDELTKDVLNYLINASNETNRLIVGVISDRLAKETGRSLKNNETDRAMLIASLRFVNVVIILDEPVEDMIAFLEPNVLPEGSNY
jgi:D-beta-D-heptose 7-phosphate kinase/D-beta-D-heptose 1-phosphate adenosyltransferase